MLPGNMGHPRTQGDGLLAGVAEHSPPPWGRQGQGEQSLEQGLMNPGISRGLWSRWVSPVYRHSKQGLGSE